MSNFQEFTINETSKIWYPSIEVNNLKEGINLVPFSEKTSNEYGEFIFNMDKKNTCFQILEQEEEEEEEEQYLIIKEINERIDKLYESGEFEKNKGSLHAQLSDNKYWNAGLNIVYFFTHNDIDRVWIGNSSSDLRCHTIFKDRKRNMIYELHYAHGKWDIFPLSDINNYLEEYKPELLENKQWMKLNEKLPYYDMVPLDCIDSE